MRVTGSDLNEDLEKCSWLFYCMYKYSQVQETVFTANQKSFTLNNFSNMKLADADNGFETITMPLFYLE